jgi:cyclic pyranopterin monophosphate synthase
MPRTTAGTRVRGRRTGLGSRRAARDRRLAEAPVPGAPRGLAGLTHLDRRGKARMVDVSAKPDTVREARARATLRLRPATLRAIRRGAIGKGDVLGVARLAGIMAAKRTAELIPLCHPLRLTGIDVQFVLDGPRSAVRIETAVRTVDKTGVEMEALTAAAGAGLAIYDMVKAIDRGMRLTDLRLVEKSGGRSGHWVRR